MLSRLWCNVIQLWWVSAARTVCPDSVCSCPQPSAHGKQGKSKYDALPGPPPGSTPASSRTAAVGGAGRGRPILPKPGTGQSRVPTAGYLIRRSDRNDSFEIESASSKKN